MNMKDHVDSIDVADAIRFELKNKYSTEKVWIIVEGETDRRLFSKLIDGNQVEIEFSREGLNGVLRIVSELLKETNRILGIRDADFLHLEGKVETAQNIFVTDYHDAEMMIIACDEAYHAVEAEYFPEEEELSYSREMILKSISFIGGIRWLNHANDLDLNFKNIGFGKFYDKRNLLHETNCLHHVMERSPKKKDRITKEAVRSKIKNIADFLNLCNGHDFQKAFAYLASSNSKKGWDADDIGRSFRVAYRFEDFQKTNLYKRLKEWSDTRSFLLFQRA
uniref:Uncharacterized protein n=1 Tax=Candidatus Kentrum sp. LPFa TaxID=2126335 RepID=A0A450X1H1_9GAMM|nr:MAG: Protein of unknown function (DUF4435) [Candidatus Kentron sp. LPFa]VFK23073.1 MAG: Protein of unknown function (DUF4435) [Candidatus Kentron sp. LPFa]